MIKKTWIKNRLVFHGNDISKVYDEFEDYKEKFNSKITQSSYERSVRNARGAVKKEKTIEEVTPDYLDYNRESLISLTQEEILETKQKVKMKDLAKKHNVPTGAFLKYLPDFGIIARDLYQNNMFHIKDDVTLGKLQAKLKLIEKENKYLKNKEVDKDLLLDAIKEVATVYYPIEKPKVIDMEHKNRVVQLNIADAHFGEVVSIEQTSINEYNPQIAKERLDRLFLQTINYCEEIGVYDIDINFMGDLITGSIHEELRENAALVTVDAVIQLADYLAQWIYKLHKEGFIIKNIRAIPGNHGRVTLKPRFKDKNKENFEWFLYEFMKRELKGIVENFIIPEDLVYITKVFDTSLALIHGDILKKGTALSPVGGTWARDAALLNGVFREHGKSFDILLFGHFHQGNIMFPSFDGTKLLSVGSIKGADEFSIAAVKAGSRPNQAIFCLEEGKKGEILFFQTLFLD